MIAHLALSPTAAHLAGRALLRSLDRRELDETPEEREAVSVLAATLGATLDVHFTGITIAIDDPVERQLVEDRTRHVVFGGTGVR